MRDRPIDARRSAPRALRRRTQLVQAAITEFSRVGFHRATMNQITRTAGVSTGLAYQYVDDKYDLLFLALQHIVEANHRELPAAMRSTTDPLLRLVRTIEAYMGVIDENRRAVLLTYRETKSLRAVDIDAIKVMELDTNALIARCIGECVTSKLLKPVHVDLLVIRIVTAAHVWALKHWRLRELVTLRDYTDACVHVCWSPLLTAVGQRQWRRHRAEATTRSVRRPRRAPG